MHEQQPAAGASASRVPVRRRRAEEPLRPGRLRRGRHPDGQRRAEPRRRFRPGQRPGVGEHPGHPPGDEPVHVPPPGDPAERVDPPLPGTRASAGRRPGRRAAGRVSGAVHRERRVQPVHRRPQPRRRVVREPAGPARQPGADPDHQRVHHRRQRPDRGTAHGPVPDRPHQRGDRRHQRRHVLVERRDRVERAQHGRERHRGKPGEQHGGDRLGHRRQRGRRRGLVDEPRGARPGDRRSPDGGVDHGDRQRRLPLHRPRLPEGPGRPHGGRRDLAEPDPQRVELVQELRPSPVELAPQVQVEGDGERRDLQPQRPRAGPQVRVERHRRRVRRARCRAVHRRRGPASRTRRRPGRPRTARPASPRSPRRAPRRAARAAPPAPTPAAPPR